MKDYSGISKLLGLLLIAILLVSGCNTNVEKNKYKLQRDYVRSIIGSKCDKAQEAYDEMVKMDPADKFPLRTYIDQNYKDMDKQTVQEINESTQYASEQLEEIKDKLANHEYKFNSEDFEDDMIDATEDLREGLNKMEAYKYKDQRPISYQNLQTYVGLCKTDKNKIPLRDLRKALELKEVKNSAFRKY